MVQLKTGPWKLSELKNIEKNGLKVFSCFHCGGGSTMGYKLAGYEVLGGVEIDPEMMKIYRLNHNPKHSYLMGVQDFKKIQNDKLPDELFDLDILDGSPPCSSFSMAGSREKAWGEQKKFREGQANQVLDDLFFHFIDIANKLKPKVIVAENVKGLVIGKAKGYVKQIYQAFELSGYDVQLFLLNSAFMGVPQKRERTFFIARRKDLNLPKITMNFNEHIITLGNATNGVERKTRKNVGKSIESAWRNVLPGESLSKGHEKGSLFSWIRCNYNAPTNTLTATPTLLAPDEPKLLSEAEYIRVQTFPDDYNFANTDIRYMCGMSVPPFMMQRVANQIAKQLFNK